MASRSSSRLSGIKRVAIFVAIVWGVAASFIIFELLSLAGFTLLLGTNTARNLAVSDTVRESTTCSSARDDATDRTRRDAQAATYAWLLGVTTGTHSRTWRPAPESSAADETPQQRRFNAFLAERSAQAARNMEQFATALQVPRPGNFSAHERSDAASLFTSWVEVDESGTARALAARYAPDVCHLFKLGAYWGYAMEIRLAMPNERTVFAPEIGFHAEKAGVPGSLWQPAFAPRSEPDPAEVQQLTQALTQHLMTTK
jgi:hypothetical protein